MKINTSKWKEFVIGDLFTVTRGVRQKAADRLSGEIPYYSASEFNNGMTDSISNPSFIEKDAIICTTFGNAFYVEGEFTASDEITILKHPKMNKYSGLFIATIIKKNKHKYSFAIKAFSTRIKKDVISLPVDDNDEPHWFKMEMVTKDFKVKLIDRLKLMKNLESVDKIHLPIETWKNFLIEDLFDKKDAKFIANRKFSKSNDVSEIKNKEFSLPLTNAKHGDNGIMYYGRPNEWDSVEMTLDVVANGAIAVGDVYVQVQPTATLGDSFLMKLKVEYKNYETENILLFLATVIEKSIKHKFSYDHKSTWNRVRKEYILLPITEDEQINWGYMNDFIDNFRCSTKKHLNNLSELMV